MEKKTKIYAIAGLLLVGGIAAFMWHKNKKKKLLASKPATTPAKTAGADGDDDDESNYSGGTLPRYYNPVTVYGKGRRTYSVEQGKLIDYPQGKIPK